MLLYQQFSLAHSVTLTNNGSTEQFVSYNNILFDLNFTFAFLFMTYKVMNPGITQKQYTN